MRARGFRARRRSASRSTRSFAISRASSRTRGPSSPPASRSRTSLNPAWSAWSSSGDQRFPSAYFQYVPCSRVALMQ